MKIFVQSPEKKKLSPDLLFYKKYIAIARDYLKQMPLFHANTSNLTFLIPMFPQFRNQSIDLICKSIDLFLYGGGIGMKKVENACGKCVIYKTIIPTI